MLCALLFGLLGAGLLTAAMLKTEQQEKAVAVSFGNGQGKSFIKKYAEKRFCKMELSTSTIIFGIINILLLLAMVVGVVALIVYLMRRNSGERKCSACGKKGSG